MRRRALLSAVSAVGSLALAGCMDRARSALDREPEVGELDPSTTTPTHSWVFEDLGYPGVRPEEAVELVVVGSGDDAHWLTVAAESGDPVETTVTIATGDGDPLYEGTHGLSNRRYFGVRFEHPLEYAVTVETDRHGETVTVDEDRIDCNHSVQAVLLATDGSVAVGGETTDMAC